MGMMENTPMAIAPLLVRNLLTSIFIYADKSLLNLAQKCRLLEILHYILVSAFLFFLRFLPSFNNSSNPDNNDVVYSPLIKPTTNDHNYVPAYTCHGGSASAIARSLSQLLSIVNDIPVNSRKYELVKSLAEQLIDENHTANVQALRDVNQSVLSAAFSRTLSQLEASLPVAGLGRGQQGEPGFGAVQNQVNRVLQVVRSRVGWARKREERVTNQSGFSAEKLAAELLWLAQKLAACGHAEEAVGGWASASNLAWLALSAEPRLQGSLVKITAFLLKQAKELGGEETEEGKKEQQRQTKMKMLMSWLPLLCRGSNGVDVPVLSVNERAEIEKVIEKTIEMLEQEDEQEQVFSLWLHHFTYCPSSDWPNLLSSYARWYNSSRKELLLH